jgi:hypothetical protein
VDQDSCIFSAIFFLNGESAFFLTLPHFEKSIEVATGFAEASGLCGAPQKKKQRLEDIEYNF